MKLMFTCNSNNPDAPNTEQLWVEILLVEDRKKLLGQLEEEPKYIADLRCGDIIEFEERHILATG